MEKALPETISRRIRTLARAVKTWFESMRRHSDIPARQAGYDAYFRGQHENPYRIGTRDHEDWFLGHEHAIGQSSW